MTISYPTSMKYVISILCTIMLTVGSMYAIDITSTSQTAVLGDKITPAWVNAVNTASVSASSGQGCVPSPVNQAGCDAIINNGTIRSIIYENGGTIQESINKITCNGGSLSFSRYDFDGYQIWGNDIFNSTNDTLTIANPGYLYYTVTVQKLCY